jgi:hypothetical protein
MAKLLLECVEREMRRISAARFDGRQIMDGAKISGKTDIVAVRIRDCPSILLLSGRDNAPAEPREGSDEQRGL